MRFKLNNRDILLGAFIGAGGMMMAQQPTIGAKIGKTVAESVPGKAPEMPVATGAPNVIWILLDDVGYGASSAFGGGAQTPVLESLMRDGLSFTNFHNAGVSSPSRAALLTGRNHHSVSMGLLPQNSWLLNIPVIQDACNPKTVPSLNTCEHVDTVLICWVNGI